ncbi:MAG: hypothetical protein LAN84_13225 [Acidobacteriia bacterium]|nr:hypothetical protein [Terriglobia bacterium]
MTSGTVLHHVPPHDPLRVLGIANLVLAGLGLTQLVVTVVGYYGLPASFIDEYAPFARHRFPAMSIAATLLLLPLAYAGIQLLRRKRHAIAFCGVLFVVETIYFAVLLSTWSLGLCPLSPLVILAGLMNGGLALQIVTAYPIIGLVLLSRARRVAIP